MNANKINSVKITKQIKKLMFNYISRRKQKQKKMIIVQKMKINARFVTNLIIFLHKQIANIYIVKNAQVNLYQLTRDARYAGRRYQPEFLKNNCIKNYIKN